MVIWQYDFKFEFFDGPEASASPKYTIETKNGSPEVNISIANDYTSANQLKCKVMNINIYNLPFNFNDHISMGNALKVYYKMFPWGTKYQLIFGGLIGQPMDTDYESGDFSVDLKIELAGTEKFYNEKLLVTDFYKKTVAEAIKSVFPTNSIIKLTLKEASRVIESNFTAQTPADFVTLLKKSKYVSEVTKDISTLDKSYTGTYIFRGFEKDPILEGIAAQFKAKAALAKGAEATRLEGLAKIVERFDAVKDLHKYALIFIPQQDLRIEGRVRRLAIYWNAQVAFTHKLSPGDLVSFKDRMDNLILGEIKTTSATLSNVGDCLLNLQIKDISSP